jgi:hypothetical protein
LIGDISTDPGEKYEKCERYSDETLRREEPEDDEPEGDISLRISDE